MMHAPEALVDDGSFQCCVRIGRSCLLCGRKSSHFPYTFFVGPDWYCMLITYSFIIVPSVFFINNIAYYWGAPVIVITVFLLSVTLGFYTMTACSDPGVVYVTRTHHRSSSSDDGQGATGVLLDTFSKKIERGNGRNESNIADQGSSSKSRGSSSDHKSADEHREGDDELLCGDVEAGLGEQKLLSSDEPSASLFDRNDQSANIGASTSVPASGVTNRIIVNNSASSNRPTHNGALGLLGTPASPYLPPPPTVECGRCEIQRPRDASHCHYCGLCVKNLDHHCPWTGKCIGEKTIHYFYGFLWSLTALVAFVVAFVLYAAIVGYELFSLHNN